MIELTTDDVTAWNSVIESLKPLHKKNNRHIKYLVNKINNKISNLRYILDLHGYTVQEAYDNLFDFIKQHNEIKTKYIVVITGKGTEEKEGLIHKEIINWFDTNRFKKYIKKYEWINSGGALRIFLK